MEDGGRLEVVPRLLVAMLADRKRTDKECQNKDLKDIEKLQQVFVPPPLDGGKEVAVVVVMAAKMRVTPPHQDAAVPQVMVPMVILRSRVQSAWTTVQDGLRWSHEGLSEERGDLWRTVPNLSDLFDLW